MLVISEDVVRHPGGVLPVVSRHAVFESDFIFVQGIEYS
jgi:hypothetical protein